MPDLWLLVATLAMEGAWIGAVAGAGGRAYVPDGGPLLPALAVWLTLSAGFACGRIVLRHAGAEPGSSARRRAPLALLLGVLWSVVLVWAVRYPGGTGGPASPSDLLGATLDPWRGLHPDLLAAAVALFAWWRGQRCGARTPDFGAVVRAFGWGSLLLAGAILATAVTRTTPEGASGHALLFLATGLPALSLARLQDVRRDAATAGGTVPGSAAGTWLRATALPVAAVVGAATGTAVLLGDDGVRRLIEDTLGWAGAALWQIVYWPLLGAGYVAEALLLLVRALAGGRQPQPAQPGAPSLRGLLPEIDPAAGLPPWLGLLRWVPVALIALAVVAGFLVTSRAARHETGPATERVAERVSLWSWGDLWRSWRRWLLRWIRRVRRAPASPGQAPAPAYSAPAAGVEGARALYRRLLGLGRASGLPRAAAQTPREYLEAWQESLPGAEDAAQVTDAYQRARYARPAATPDPAPPRAALERLARALSRRPPGPAGSGR